MTLSTFSQFSLPPSTLNLQLSTIHPPLPLEKAPVNRHRLDAARSIRLGTVHQVADRINLQRLLQRMTAKVVSKLRTAYHPDQNYGW